MIKANSKNLGREVRFTIKSWGGQTTERVATLKSFRGAGRGTHAAWVSYRLPSGQYRLTCVELHALEWVS